MIDYYSILGLNRDCTREEIKSAYHRLAKQYHPDVNKSPGAAEKFRKISEAYEYLIKVRDGEQPDIPEYRGNGSGSGRAATGGGSRANGLRPVEEIIAALNSQDREVVRAAVEALGSRRFLENSGVINILIGYLRSSDVALRRSAITALGRLGNPVVAGDLAKMLRDGETQVRFDAVVAMGNIGAPVALTYLEMMDPDDPRNDALVMNARRETIYGIKKKNRMYPPSRMCPSCGGYDIVNRSAPFKCHECGRSFGQSGGQQEADRGHGAGYDGAGSKTGTSKGCASCHREGPLAKCEYCGQSCCTSHISPGAHHCWYMNYKHVEDRWYSGGSGLFGSKTVRNLAILSVLLLLMMIIGAVVIMNGRDRTDFNTYVPTQSANPTIHLSYTVEDYAGIWYSRQQNSSVANTYDDSYLNLYPDKTFTIRQNIPGASALFHGRWSDRGASGLLLNYSDGMILNRPATLQLLPLTQYSGEALAFYPNGSEAGQYAGVLYRKISSTPDSNLSGN
jgi:hypothetical protein